MIAGNPQAIRYGIELDAYRVEQAREVGHHVIHGDALNVHCPVESLSLLYLNPPYDFECGQSQNRRLEEIFFEHCSAGSSLPACWFWSFPEIVSPFAGAFSPFTSRTRKLTGWARRRLRSTSRLCCSVPGVRAVNAIGLSDADLIKAQDLIAEMSLSGSNFPSSLTLPVQSTRFQKADLSS